MANDWVKIHRSMFEDEWYFSEKFTRTQAWIDLLLLAEEKEKHLYVRSILVVLERGQLALSIRSLAERWRWGKDKVQFFIGELEQLGRISTQKSNVINTITICNYDSYKIAAEETSTQIRTQTSTQMGGKEAIGTQNLKGVSTQKPTTNHSNTDSYKIAAEETSTQIRTQTSTQMGGKEKESEKESFPLQPPYKEKDKEKESVLTDCGGDSSAAPLSQPSQQEAQPMVFGQEKPKRVRNSNPLITPCRGVFEEYYNELFDSTYYWKAKDSVAMSSLTKKIIFSRESKGMPIGEEDIKSALKAMLHSIQDEWILKNFSVTIIDSKYNEIVAQAKRKPKSNQYVESTNNQTDNASTSQSRANDVAALIARLNEQNKPVEN